MQRLSTWRVCRSCAQQYGLPLRSHSRPAAQQLRHISWPTLGGKNKATATEAKKADDQVEINYYERFAPGQKGIRRIEQNEFEERGTVDEIKARISKLEAQLAELEAGKEVENLSPADRKILEDVMSADHSNDITGKDITSLLDGSEDDPEIQELAHELDLEFHLPPEQKRNLGKLATLLQQVPQDYGNTRLRRSLWQQYVQCKDQLPGFEEQLPKDAWDTLWKSQYEADAGDESRARHLWILADDMARNEQELSGEQTLVRIEARIAQGEHKAAFKMWEKARDQLEKDKDVFEPFTDLGPHLLALLKRPKEAQKLALELSKDSPRISIFIPVLEAWLADGDQASVKRAWALYIRAREVMKQHMTLEDYDRLVMIFFKGGQKESALAIFKDLVLAGKKSEFDSLAVRNKSMDMIKGLTEQPQDAEALNQLSLTSLTFLPRSFQNKFFYAMWMKRLIGMGEIEAAASVIELMYMRSVRADPRHINGLIGALFRRGRPSDKETAINLGWAMIDERIKFVAQRRARSLQSQDPNAVPVPALDDASTRLPPYLGKNLPPATTETFALLVLHYTRSSMTSSVEKLNTALQAAELTPNTYYVNHLLQGRLRAGDRPGLWNLFVHATSSHNTLVPDLSTYSCLWDAEKAHVTANPAARRELAHIAQVNFPGPRKLFAYMATWLESLPQKTRDEVTVEFAENHAVYTQILRCFCLTLDLPGTLVAMYAMRDLFGVYPDADDVRLVSIQLARSSESPRGGWKKRRVGRLGDRKESQERLVQVTKVLKILDEERAQVLAEMDVKKDELGEVENAEEGLWLIAGLVRNMMEAKDKARAEARGLGSVEELPPREAHDVEKIAWKMGVGPLQMGSPVYEKYEGSVELVGFQGQVVGKKPEGEEWKHEEEEESVR